jgi:hypothetical protein
MMKDISDFYTDTYYDNKSDDAPKNFAPVRKCATTDNLDYEKERSDTNDTFHFIQIST